MPARTNKSAPSFSGNPKDLEDYLEDVKRVCDEHGKKNDSDFVEYALHYLPADERESWKTLPESRATANHPIVWVDFVKAVMAIYPGSSRKGRYELVDLENLVMDQGRKAPRDLETLGSYTRNFKRIGALLEEENVLSGSELSRLYVKGLGATLRETVNRRLEIKHPDHSLLRPHALSDIVKEAEFCLSG
ncbi:hypothetical protein BDZ89DRAFT_900760, partial [Hymenopellis radicata]